MRWTRTVIPVDDDAIAGLGIGLVAVAFVMRSADTGTIAGYIELATMIAVSGGLLLGIAGRTSDTSDLADVEDYIHEQYEKLEQRRQAVDPSRADDFETRLDAVRELEDIDGGQEVLYDLLQYVRELQGDAGG